METRHLRIAYLNDRLRRADEALAKARRALNDCARRDRPRDVRIELLRAVCDYRERAKVDCGTELDLAMSSPASAK